METGPTFTAKPANITIDGKTYALKEIEPEEPRRLIMSIVFGDDKILPIEGKEQWAGHLMVRWQEALKTVFAHKFPDATEFREVYLALPGFCEWKCILSNAQEKHIDWARDALRVGIIDTYLVDYGVCLQQQESGE